MVDALWRPGLSEWPEGWRPATAEEERLWTEQLPRLLSPGHQLTGRSYSVIGCSEDSGSIECVLVQLNCGGFAHLALIDMPAGPDKYIFPETDMFDSWASWFCSTDPNGGRSQAELTREYKRFSRRIEKAVRSERKRRLPRRV